MGFIKYQAYYGTFTDYSKTPKETILFYTSVSNNIEELKVLNDPVLDWEVGRAGGIIFKLPPSNVGYNLIECKRYHIFIERNGELIWHGRAINDTFDDDRNREITCEGALNYLLDTHIKPFEIIKLAKYRYLFNNLIECHNSSLNGRSSIVVDPSSWQKYETNGTIEVDPFTIIFRATGTTQYGLSIWSSPSLWRYRDYDGKIVRISFTATKYGNGSGTLISGLHLRNEAFAYGQRILYKEGTPVSTSQKVTYTIYLGPTGLDGTNHEDAYLGFHMYFNASADESIHITDLNVEVVYDFTAGEKSFPVEEGLRTGILRIPFADTSSASSVDIRDYPTTLDAINSIFINTYGGYLYISYDNNQPILNYAYGNAEKDEPSGPYPEIRYGKNLISCKETTDYSNYPTVFIPLGRQKETWEKAAPAAGVSYISGKYIDTDGNVQNDGTSSHYIAELSVSEGDVYYIYGEGTNDLGLYTIINSQNSILDHKTFSNKDGNWYKHVEIVIPQGGSKLYVFFNNVGQHNPPPTTVFKVNKYAETDVEDYITLEDHFASMRDDIFVGSKYALVSNEEDIIEYGWIEQVLHFDDANDKDELWSAFVYYKQFFEKIVKTYEAEAAELAPITGDSDYIPIGMPGSYANLIVPKMNINKLLCVTKVSLHLRDFAKSTYSLANLPPPDLADLVAKGLYL